MQAGQPKTTLLTLDLLVDVWKRTIADDCVDMAAQMSFFFVLSLFPFLLLMAALLSWLPYTPAWQPFAQWITDYLPSESRQFVIVTILNLGNTRTAFLSFGFIGSIWAASSAFVSVMESMTTAYGCKDERGFLEKRGIAVGATMVCALFFFGSFGLLTANPFHRGLFSNVVAETSSVHFFWTMGRWSVTLLLICLALDVVNYFLPAKTRRWRWITPGTLFVAISFAVSSVGVNLYVREYKSFPQVYGTIGGFIILMLWIYVLNLVLLIGAETDHAIESRQAQSLAGR